MGLLPPGHRHPRAAGRGLNAYEQDVVGIGALNLDYIADPGTPLEAEWGTETAVDAATINSAIQLAGPERLTTTLGGSAFNTVHAIASSRPGLRLGYVGAAGRNPTGGPSPRAGLAALGIDHRHVSFTDQALSGICFSLTENGDRTMLTHAGANRTFPEHVDRHFDALVSYLSRTRLVHVTSLLDDASAGRLLTLLTAVKTINPATVLSFDPGHVWSTEVTPDIERLVRLSDYLLLNRREFAELRTVLNRTEAVVVVKNPDHIEVRRPGARPELHPQIPLPDAEIVDATGAGDVFAGGLLIGLAQDAGLGAGCRLGMRLARHKLQHIGATGHDGFAALTDP
ncbi:carbohydrate kinase family protein [Winogradskya consettensis]|uniref:Ribokinase n=1 Tax=Winogradskya consettensis TaxID=113560 RepID=A0A919VZ26_9ACTN|nr:PfkB family carbohydrate kinase [Actinoplanes consettensis]GIM80005.1 ribokinase [Actinoplanes consettensis]